MIIAKESVSTPHRLSIHLNIWINDMLGWIALILIFTLFSVDAIRFGVIASLISSFWVFTFFFILSYPVKYVLITVYEVEYQAPIQPSEQHLMMALVIAILFWGTVYLFRRKPRNILWKRSQLRNGMVTHKSERISGIAQLTLLVMCGVSLVALVNLLIDNAFALSLAFEGNSQNEARVGSGPMFLMYVLYAKAFLIALFISERKQAYLVAIIGAVFVAAFLEMILLGTRRPPYLTVYVLLLWSFMQTRSTFCATLLAFYPVAAAAMAPIGQVLRYSFTKVFQSTDSLKISMDYALVSLGSTFEGVEHLANFISRLKAREWLIGVDQGIAWIFNSGLAFVPRVIWESKPYIYGSVAEQYFIYPSMYESGPAQTTYPPGIVVDAMFGFGLLSFIPMAFIFAKGLSFLDKKIFVGDFYGGHTVVMCSAVYVYMFNLVRGGTSIVMMVVMLGVMLAVILALNRVRLKRSVWPGNYPKEISTHRTAFGV